MKIRLDEALVQKQLFPTRSQAKRAIQSGEVLVNGRLVNRAGFLVDEKSVIKTIVKHLYVGRGALKLKAATEAFKIAFKDKIVADIGASTGGFTDYALKEGASKVYAIDVGHDQLAPALKSDLRVINKEGVNIREGVFLSDSADIAVVDLSFISLRLCLPQIFKLVHANGQVICLFKPQFEGGRQAVNKQGVIRLKKDRMKILDHFLIWCNEQGYFCKQWIESPVVGQKGNVEYLLLFDCYNE